MEAQRFCQYNTAYYDHNLFNIQFVEFSPAAEKSLLQHNKSLIFITSRSRFARRAAFISVIDAVPAEASTQFGKKCRSLSRRAIRRDNYSPTLKSKPRSTPEKSRSR